MKSPRDAGRGWQLTAPFLCASDNMVTREPLRVPIRKTVLLYDLDISAAYRCMMRDHSAAGCRIQIPQLIDAPLKDVWVIDPWETVAYVGNVIWRRGWQVGVEFSAQLALGGENTSGLWDAALRQLEHQEPIYL